MSVDIVLATYNGSKYIKEQIDSILCQTYSNFSILISDDGSIDDTLHKIKLLARNDSRIKLINDKRVGGVVNNFGRCLEFSSGDYILFADQDDIWLPQRLEQMISFIKQKELDGVPDIPILCFSDLTLVDNELDILSDSFYKSNKLNPKFNLHFNYLIWRSTVYGCSCIFNKKLRAMALPFPEKIPMHDHWLALKCLHGGAIYYFDKSTILYRQHDSNVVGGAGYKKTYLQKLCSVGSLLSKIKQSCDGSIAMQNAIDTRIGFLRFFFQCFIPFFSERKIFSLLFLVFYFYASLKIFLCRNSEG